LIEEPKAGLHRLRNKNGMQVSISPFGGIVQTLTAPDRHGHYADVVLGFDTMQEYRGKHPYFGALIGRFANRIGNSRVVIDGMTYHLTPGKGGNHLHGGGTGFDKVFWNVDVSATTEQTLRLTHTSIDGDEGYPGELSVAVVYTLADNDEVSIHYSAKTDKATIINLSNHSYFNLATIGATDILDHVVELNADVFTPVNNEMIPTGELRSVTETPMDLREPTRIGAQIDDDYEQLAYGSGFDHNWVLNRTGEGLEFAARVTEPISGRILEVMTTEPGVQFYSGNRLDGSIIGKGGRAYQARAGFCLETQHFPDSPNQVTFPSTILRPGETYESTTVYRFLSG